MKMAVYIIEILLPFVYPSDADGFFDAKPYKNARLFLSQTGILFIWTAGTGALSCRSFRYCSYSLFSL